MDHVPSAVIHDENVGGDKVAARAEFFEAGYEGDGASHERAWEFGLDARQDLSFDDRSPAYHDRRAAIDRGPAWVGPHDWHCFRPKRVYRLEVVAIEGLVETLVGGQDSLFLGIGRWYDTDEAQGD